MSPPWQLDFYRRPLQDTAGNPLWELLLCDAKMAFSYSETCPQWEANAQWLQKQFSYATERAGYAPSEIQVFRPQTLPLAELAGKALEISVVAKRNLPTLKQWLSQRAAWYSNLNTYTGEPYHPLEIERLPPLPLPEDLWGDQWQFAGISNADLLKFQFEPVPYLSIPPELRPLELGLPITTLIPGVIIDGGRQSMALAQWVKSVQPVFVKYMSGAPDGLILEAGLNDRWVLATFDDTDVQGAANTFEQRKQSAKGLHFLLVRPDGSGVTYTGLWLLQEM
ncbi:MAG: Tab2/Atab2 family RNA-binding protein [Cyanobacteria bacterium P01_A01_bin.114]